MAEAPRRSERYPATIPPTTPPTSKRMERAPASLADRVWPWISAGGRGRTGFAKG